MVADDEAPARQRIIDLLRRDSRVAAIIEADGLPVPQQEPLSRIEAEGFELVDALPDPFTVGSWNDLRIF
jgi:hypothetical protein